MTTATDPSDCDSMPSDPHSARLVEAFRGALIRMRDGEDNLAVEDLDTAAALLLTVQVLTAQATNGGSLAAEVMPLFRQVFQDAETGSHRPALATSPSHPTYSDPFHKGSL